MLTRAVGWRFVMSRSFVENDSGSSVSVTSLMGDCQCGHAATLTGHDKRAVGSDLLVHSLSVSTFLSVATRKLISAKSLSASLLSQHFATNAMGIRRINVAVIVYRLGKLSSTGTSDTSSVVQREW